MARFSLQSLGLLLALAFVFASPPANMTLIKYSTFVIPANVEWTETFYLEPGDYVVIGAFGKWRYDPRPQFETGPDGLSNVFTTFKPGTLQGKFGDGDVIPIGSSWEGYASNRGKLLLGMYEPKGTSAANYNDNLGNVSVNMFVYSRASTVTIDAGTDGQDNTQQPGGGETTPLVNNTDNQGPSPTEKTCISSIVLFLSGLVSLGILTKYDLKQAS
jgi:hypothetical protein